MFSEIRVGNFSAREEPEQLCIRQKGKTKDPLIKYKIKTECSATLTFLLRVLHICNGIL